MGHLVQDTLMDSCLHTAVCGKPTPFACLVCVLTVLCFYACAGLIHDFQGFAPFDINLWALTLSPYHLRFQEPQGGNI